MDVARRLDRPSLHGMLVQTLRDMVTEGELEPGEKINEKALCDSFAVSRTPLREALKVLASEGLVTLTPNRGATVTETTERDLEEIFSVLMALEGMAGELTCANMPAEMVARLRELQEEMKDQFERGDRAAYFRTNQLIHDTILEGSGNRTLISTHRALAGRIRRARYLANMSRERWSSAVAEHDEILAAIEARDPDRACNLLKRHLANKRDALRESAGH